jgi:transcriptional regulator with XRE-family HTH domain
VTQVNREQREVVARNITRARKAAGYSVNRLAKESGIDRRLLHKYEAADHEPTARNLLKLAGLLGQPLEWFYANHNGDLPADD